MDFENSQTKKNLETAFAGESQAHTKYRYYASKAKKDGYVQISNIFAETAGNESEHAKLWFKYLHDGVVPDTLDNLRDAAAGENTSGPRCTMSLPRPPRRRALPRLPQSSVESPPSRRPTRSATTNSSSASSRARCLSARA